MLMPRWKENLLSDMFRRTELLETNLKKRLNEEVNKGFDSRDEMREVFLDIADEFNVSPNIIWSMYYDSDW